MGWVLAVIGLAGFVVAAFALARGYSWKPAAILLLASWLALFEGGTLASNAAEKAAPQPSSTPSAAATPSPSPSPTPASTAPVRPEGVPAGAVEAGVSRTVDGATFLVTGAGLPAAGQMVRLVGLDVPAQAACYGPEASEFLSTGLAVGSKVFLLAGSPDKDSKGALLRYAWSDQGDFVNEAVARAGMGKATQNSATDELATRIKTAGAAAQEAETGLWTECAAKPKTAASPRPKASPQSFSDALAPPDDTCINCPGSADPSPSPTPDDDLKSLLPNHDNSGSAGSSNDGDSDEESDDDPPDPEPSPDESPDPIPSPDISPLEDPEVPGT